jgi:hypothetical protein
MLSGKAGPVARLGLLFDTFSSLPVSLLAPPRHANGQGNRADSVEADSGLADSRSRKRKQLGCLRRIEAGNIGLNSPSKQDLTAWAFPWSGTMQMMSADFTICSSGIEMTRFGAATTHGWLGLA